MGKTTVQVSTSKHCSLLSQRHGLVHMEMEFTVCFMHKQLKALSMLPPPVFTVGMRNKTGRKEQAEMND